MVTIQRGHLCACETKYGFTRNPAGPHSKASSNIFFRRRKNWVSIFYFLSQVALDGLGKLLKCPVTWNVLSILEKQDTITEYLHILLDQSKLRDDLADDIVKARMLEVIDSADVLHTILNLPDKQEVGKLLKYLLELLPPITSSSGKFDIL